MRLQYDRFELDVDALALRSEGKMVPLQPKVFGLLRILMERQGSVVTKSQLFDALWPSEFVSDAALTWCVSQARKALGQLRSAKRPIETVHRRGYRFLGSVVSVARTVGAPTGRAETRAGDAQAVPAEPFVGREAVLRQLGRALASANRGIGRFCLITGEAGIGKTRTVHELAAQARHAGFDIWQGRSFPADGAPALWPWVQVLRDAMTNEELVPEVNELLASIASPATSLEDDGSIVASQQTMFWIVDRVTRFLLQAEAAPRMLILEDLHEADDASLRLLLLLAQALSRAPVLVIATLRVPARLTEQQQQRCDALARLSERFDLDGLDAGAIESYARGVLGRALSQGSCELLLSKTGGVPLFVREGLERLAQVPSASDAEAAAHLEIPNSARDMVSETLRTLRPLAGELLDLASVIGAEFTVSTLQRAWKHSPEELLLALDEAVAARILRPRDTYGRFGFRHDLLRELVYERLPVARRTELHLRVGAALEPALPVERIGEIAYHYHRALPLASADTALKYACEAADSAARLGAFEHAARLQSWALDAFRVRGIAEPREFAQLLAQLAELQRASGQHSASQMSASALIDHAKHHALPDMLLRSVRTLRASTWQACLADPLALDALETARSMNGVSDLALESSALSYLSQIPPHSYDMLESKRMSAEAVALAKRVNQRGVLLDALRSRLYSLSGPTDSAALLAVADEMLGMMDSQGAPIDVYREVQLTRFVAFLQQGQVDRADEALANFARAARQSKVPEGIWHADRLAATRALARGEYDAAERLFQELEERRQQLNFNYHWMFLGPQVFAILRERGQLKHLKPVPTNGWPNDSDHDAAGVPRMFEIAFVPTLAKLGREAEARAIFESLAAHEFATIPENSSYLWLIAESAEAAIALKDRERADIIYSRLSPYADLNVVHVHGFSLGAVSHYLARLAQLLERPAAARSLFERAIERNDRMAQPTHAARSRYLLARMLRDVNRKHANELLEAVDNTARTFGMTPLSERARQLRSQLA